MAIINILPNGTTSGNPSMGNKKPPKRGKATGWTHSVSKRLRKWLYSVPVGSLNGYGIAFTLTVRDCPKTAKAWADHRNAFIKRMFRKKCIRLQWLTEWQQRGVPHLHGVAYFQNPVFKHEIIDDWIDIVGKPYGAKKWSQDCKEITDVLGWLDYLAKHAARSATHYQRSPENIPDGWSETGRMWGYRGNWETREAMRFEIDQDGFYRFRRIAKGIYHSNARQRLTQALREPIPDHIGPDQERQFRRDNHRSKFLQYSMSKKSLQANDANMGRMMGTSDWLDQDQALKIILWLGSQGADIVQS